MKRLYRDELIELATDALPTAQVDDLPAIRQTLNNLADMFRRYGYTVTDFDQDRMVRSVQLRLAARAKQMA